MKKLISLLIFSGLTLAMAGAQNNDLRLFLQDYLKIHKTFVADMDKAATSTQGVAAMEKYMRALGPLKARSEALEAKYGADGDNLLATDATLAATFEKDYQDMSEGLSRAMMKLMTWASEDPAAMEAIQRLSSEMEDDSEDEEDF